MKIAAAAAALLALAGCSSIATPRSPERAAALEAGKSTRQDVLAALGLPNETFREPVEGQGSVEGWVYYRWADRSTVHVATGYGTTMDFSTLRRGKPRKDHAATVVFSEAGVVLEVLRPLKEKP